MRPVFLLAGLLCAAGGAMGQTGTASVQGQVLDAKSQKPIPSAIVTASRTAVPPLSKRTRSGGDGGFQIQGLTAGIYSLCVQVPDLPYLDPCEWGGSPPVVTVAAGQNAAGILLRLTLGSVLNVQVLDAQSALRQRTVDGRRPELRVGVWGPRGFYYPARAAGSPGADGNLPGGAASYSYHLAVPFDTPLSFSIGSRDLRLGDENGVELSANSRRETFQHASREASPRRFSFRVLGLMR